MATANDRRGVVVGYNMQTAVDARHHLVVAHELTNKGSDRSQLLRWPLRQDRAEAESLTVLADRGYYEGWQTTRLRRGRHHGTVPKPDTSPARARGLLGEGRLLLPARYRHVSLPYGEELPTASPGKRTGRSCTSTFNQKHAKAAHPGPVHHRQGEAHTPLEHETVLDRVQARLEACRKRWTSPRCTVEHVFATLKTRDGRDPLPNARPPKRRRRSMPGDPAYIMKRAIAVGGRGSVLRAIRA